MKKSLEELKNPKDPSIDEGFYTPETEEAPMIRSVRKDIIYAVRS